MDAGLTTTEHGQLSTLEGTIEKGLKTFVDVGDALLVIRDQRLWRGDYADFTAYCQVRWGFTRRRANQLIEAADVMGELASGSADWTDGKPVEPADEALPLFEEAEHDGNHGSHEPAAEKPVEPEPVILPANERQVRELAQAPEGERKETWDEAVKTAPKDEDGTPKVTADHIQKVVAKRKQPPGGPPAEVVPTDREKHPLPSFAVLRESFEQAKQTDGIILAIAQIKAKVSELPDLCMLATDRQRVIAELNNAAAELKHGRPHSVCPYCKGDPETVPGRVDGKECPGCRGAKWVKKQTFDTAPEDMRLSLPKAELPSVAALRNPRTPMEESAA